MIDQVLGVAYDYLYKNAKGGDTWRNEYINNKVNSDILILGSSRASHHYDPSLITSSLGLTCFNSGTDGNGIILSYGRLCLMKERMYQPKIVIYDVNPNFDLLQGEDNNKYLGWLRPYYSKKCISCIFEAVDSKEKYKMLSQLYKYNSKFIQITSDYLLSKPQPDYNGYEPILSEMDTTKIRKKEVVRKYSFDSIKLRFLTKIVEENPEVQFVFCISPIWYGMDEEQYSIITSFCKDRAIPFVNFANNPKYVHNNIYFSDGVHLNDTGAKEFTHDFIEELYKLNIDSL